MADLAASCRSWREQTPKPRTNPVQTTTIVDLSGCLSTLLVLCGVPALLLFVALIAQLVIYG
jgi:hypothetical protein